jgi:hypothetical protein
MASKKGNPNKDSFGRFSTGSSYKKQTSDMKSNLYKAVPDTKDFNPVPTVTWSTDQKVFYKDIIKAFGGKPKTSNKTKRTIAKYNYKKK